MSAPEVTVIDYGVGNLLSVQRGLEHCGAIVTLTADPEIILTSTRVVLPGVGAFAHAMQALERLKLVNVIHEVAQKQIPLLGICLGMQLLLDDSEEFGLTRGLGLIPGHVIPVPDKTLVGLPQKIPHIGWSGLQPSGGPGRWGGTLLQDNYENEATYFVHSYMAVPINPAHIVAHCVYGGHSIPATIAKEKVTGCQFHPEKSGEAGLKILRRFCFD